jgi:cytidylate kinase
MNIFKLRKGVDIMYFITLSEMMGTNGEKIAKQVAEKLNYSFYGEAELMKSAAEMGFLKDLQGFGEKGPALFEKFFSERPKVSLDRVQSVIFEVAKNGNAVFFGRGSQLLLRSFECALHVLVTGSPEKRIERVMELNKVGHEVAEKMAERSDQDKKGFLRFAFDEDWLNPHLYDLVLNTDKLSVDCAAKMIFDAAGSNEIKACGIDSVKNLGKLSVQRRIEAAFLESGFSNRNLFFDIEDVDSVRVFGIAGTAEEKEEIEKVIRKTKVVKKVTNDLTVFRGASGGI